MHVVVDPAGLHHPEALGLQGPDVRGQLLVVRDHDLEVMRRAAVLFQVIPVDVRSRDGLDELIFDISLPAYRADEIKALGDVFSVHVEIAHRFRRKMPDRPRSDAEHLPVVLHGLLQVLHQDRDLFDCALHACFASLSASYQIPHSFRVLSMMPAMRTVSSHVKCGHCFLPPARHSCTAMISYWKPEAG